MNNSKYESVASSSKTETRSQNTVASSSTFNDDVDSIYTSNDNLEKNTSAYPGDVDYKDELKQNLEDIGAYAFIVQDKASDMLSGQCKEEVDAIASKAQENFQELKDLSLGIEMSNSEDNDPQINKSALETANEACDAVIKSVAKTDEIFQANVIIRQVSDMEEYNDNISRLDELKEIRAAYASKYADILDATSQNPEGSEELSSMNQGSGQALDSNPEGQQVSEELSSTDKGKGTALDWYPEGQQVSEELSSTDKGKGRALDWYPEDKELSEESSSTNKGKGRALDLYPEDSQDSVKKPKNGGSLLDDYADTSTEFGDWTGGDD